MANGVYFGFADLGKYKNHPAIVFIGIPTTVGDKDRRVEAYLLDIPDEDHYGEELRLVVQHKHRENQTFDSVDALIEVMKDDEAIARRWFGL